MKTGSQEESGKMPLLRWRHVGIEPMATAQRRSGILPLYPFGKYRGDWSRASFDHSQALGASLNAFPAPKCVHTGRFLCRIKFVFVSLLLPRDTSTWEVPVLLFLTGFSPKRATECLSCAWKTPTTSGI